MLKLSIPSGWSRVDAAGARWRVRLRGLVQNLALATIAIGATATAASAETLLMPNRDMQAGVSEVVWGITTLPNGSSTYDIDFGDGTPHATGNVSDRSYIAVNHSYAASNPNVTVTLKVTNGATVETATATVNVYNAAILSVDAARELGVNRAIQNGLRSLWYYQTQRTTFDTAVDTSWSAYNGGVSSAFTALVVQAFQNQGYRLPNADIAPTGIYTKYVVRRGINYMLRRLYPLTVGTTLAGNNACAGTITNPCNALYSDQYGHEGYENGMVMFALAGSGALSRTNVEATRLTTSYAETSGMKIGEILQRVVNASIWGQNDSGNGRGGWYYSFNTNGNNTSDGSVNGWELLGLLDAESAGVVVPNWVKTEWAAAALPNAINTDGSYDYRDDANPAACYGCYRNIAKTGIGLQGMFFAGRPSSNTDVQHALTWIKDDWNSALSRYNCSGGTDNKGCSYGMFNVFKGLKLYGVPTLPGIGYVPPAGSSIAADDWYADYVDWLVAHQTSPTSTTGGYWGGMYFSGAYSYDQNAGAAVALLILSPTALVLPDPTKFETLGLQQGNPLSTSPATNPVTTPPGTHTVTGITVSATGSPIPGVTITFKVTSGPNNGQTGTGVTGTNGQVAWTYTDNGGAGTDNIQANVGALFSNVLVKNWVKPVAVCDMNNDGKIDITDITKIVALRNTTPASPNWDARADADFNGTVNSVDQRICALRCTKPLCAQ